MFLTAKREKIQLNKSGLLSAGEVLKVIKITDVTSICRFILEHQTHCGVGEML